MLRTLLSLTHVISLLLCISCVAEPEAIDGAEHALDDPKPPRSDRAKPRRGRLRGRGRPRCKPDAAVPPAPSSCLFGEQFSDLRAHPRLELLEEQWIRSESELDGPLEGEQLVRAVQQSSHVDVTTAAEALARVDQAEVRRMVLADRDLGTLYKALEYGVGDNSYGAIFAADDAAVLARIHDGDLLDCLL